MNELLKTTLVGLFFGTFGTTIGGLIGIKFKNTSNKFLSFVMSFASGLMIAIVSFELVPEALEITNVGVVLCSIIFGIIAMIICDILVDKKFSQSISKRENAKSTSWNNKKGTNIKEKNIKEDLLKTGIIVSIGLAIHNFPEGLAIGSGFEASIKLGISLAIAICLHDIPEGLAMAVPMKSGGISSAKVIYYVILSGVTTGIGAFFGALVGGISQNVIAMCLGLAAGAMTYIVSGELIPESNSLYQGRMTAIGNMIGFIIGIFAMNI